MKIEDAVCKNCVFFKPPVPHSFDPKAPWKRRADTDEECMGFCMFKSPSRYGRPHTTEQDRCAFFTDATSNERPFYLFGIQQNAPDEQP